MKTELKINEYARSITTWRIGRGFQTPSSISTEPERDLMLGKLMLVVSEVAEASEAVRTIDNDNFAEELADAFIRLMDITATCGIDIERHIIDKMQRNELRPFKHGKHSSL